MARSLNKAQIIGNLGKDAETRFTQGGTAVTNFSVATTRRWKDQQSEEWKEETDWHNVTMWKGENLAPYLTKGTKVYVEGRLQTRSYEKDGVTHYRTEIISENIILLGDKQEGGESQQETARPAARNQASAGRRPAARRAAPPARGRPAPAGDFGLDEDDLPPF